MGWPASKSLLMDKDSESVAHEMTRDLFLAPELLDEDDEAEDPLLEQARENVADDVDEIEARKEERGKKP
jgi:hypothetical protein